MLDLTSYIPPDAFVGGVASLLNTTTWHPLYTVKNSYMTGQGFPALSRLYRGYRMNATSDASNQTVAFFVNGFFAKTLMGNKELEPSDKIIGGLLAGMIAAPVVCFWERLMIIQQTSQDELSKRALSAKQAFQKIFQQEGLRGFTRGLLPTILRESTNAACFFGVQRYIEPVIKKEIEDPILASFFSFLTVGALAGFVTTPADLIKTTMQATIGDKASMRQVVYRLIETSQHKAIFALFKGCVPRTILISCLMSTMGTYARLVPRFLPENYQPSQVI